jgi:hypothetical protein
MGFSFPFPPYKGISTNPSDNHQEPFEFYLRANYKAATNVIQLSFFIQKMSSFAGIIKNILETIDNYKNKAREIEIIPASPSEISIGKRQPIFSNHFYFYIDGKLTEAEKKFLEDYCADKLFSIQIRTSDYLEFMIEKQKIYAFISHDTRDQALIARPLANALNSRQCYVWYSEYSLELGQNLRESIHRGIKEAGKCILVLTKNFLSNPGWTKWEFNAIFAKEMRDHEDIIIPIWYGVTTDEINDYSSGLELKVAHIWPSPENKTKAEYEMGVQRGIDKICNLLKKTQ